MVLAQRRAFLFEAHVRYAPSAAGLYALDGKLEDLAGPRQYREVRREVIPSGILRQRRTPPAIDDPASIPRTPHYAATGLASAPTGV